MKKVETLKMNPTMLTQVICIGFFFIFQFSFSNSAQAQQSKHVLFIGNSYTQVNNLPQMVANVASSMGDTLYYEENTPGGCTFSQHCTNQSMTLIQQGGWDAVVLQEQSQLPSFPQSRVENECFPYAQRLVDSIYAHGWCTEPMFYMTWGRKNGDQQNAQFFSPLATYEGMDSLLFERYREMASDNDASVCPVGRVWRRLRENYRTIELYQSDGSHPSVAGSYAAACAFYTMLFARNPEEITFDAGLDVDVAQSIRGVVRSVVYDSLPSWRRVPPTVQVVVADTIQYMSCSFVLDCVGCDTLLCDWGDGTTEVYSSPVVANFNHCYSDAGDYIITFNALRHCMATAVNCSFHASEDPSGPQGIEEAAGERITLSPNPASSSVTVRLPTGALALELCGLDGRVIFSQVPQKSCCVLNVSALQQGTYILRIVSSQGIFVSKLSVAR